MNHIVRPNCILYVFGMNMDNYIMCQTFYVMKKNL